MSILDGVRDSFRWLVGRESPIQARTELDPLEDLFARRFATRTSPWRRATKREAIGVPAVLKAVSLISNTIGTLSMEAYRNGVRLDAIDTPRMVIRPNPLPDKTPYDFWRDSTYYKAMFGETWWYVAKRDLDGLAISLFPVDPREITVERNTRNPLRPIIKWFGQEMPNDDMRLMKYLPDPNDPYRGIGPLQACGAAVSVAVESQEWAANFFAGNPSNTLIQMDVEMDSDEALAAKTAWMEGASNLPKVVDSRVKDVKEIGTDPEKAQLGTTRLFQNGEVALMFSMPPTLLNYAVQGSTITYQNVGQVADDFLRQCLLPHYLEPMEQTMSDLLTRSTVGRFNVEGLRRADIKTRFDVYGIGVDKGIITPDEARQAEGYQPGDVENRPVPFAPPQAVPDNLPVQIRSLRDLRCDKCGRLAGRVGGPAEIKCRACNTVVVAA